MFSDGLGWHRTHRLRTTNPEAFIHSDIRAWFLLGPTHLLLFPSFSVSLTGPQPSESARTKAVFSISGRNTSGWSAALKASNGNNLFIAIASPVSAPIGLYTLNVEVSSKGRVSSVKLGTFTVLFNPWQQGRSLSTAFPHVPDRNNECAKERRLPCAPYRLRSGWKTPVGCERSRKLLVRNSALTWLCDSRQ